jgi:hypothetical protein
MKSFPLIQQADFDEVILHPGDMLFIPRWCWHFISSIDAATAKRLEKSTSSHAAYVSHEYSISVSFWWGQRLSQESIGSAYLIRASRYADDVSAQ